MITKRQRLWSGMLAATAVVGTAMGLVADASADPPPISVEPLTTRTVFTDDVAAKFRVKLDGHETEVRSSQAPLRTVTAKLTVQPGAVFPWHTHPGPVLVSVTDGELVYLPASDCVSRPYPAGTAFVDPGRGIVHTAYNRGAVPTIAIATFFDVGESGPLSITEGITAPDDCSPAVGG